MSTNETTNTAADQASEKSEQAMVLSLDRVSTQESAAHGIKLHRASLKLRRGDLIIIPLSRRQHAGGFSSVTLGLKSPLRGSVVFEAKDWASASAEQQFKMRGQIGRVFDGQAWVNNLNVTENVTLKAQHHGFPINRLHQHIDQWSAKLKIPALTRQRPAFVEKALLQQYQWLRAFIGSPSLVILERPMKSLDSAKLPSLAAAVNLIRQQSAAVIWLGGNEVDSLMDSPDQPLLTGHVRRFEASDGVFDFSHPVATSGDPG